jgi:hypothetical protein
VLPAIAGYPLTRRQASGDTQPSILFMEVDMFALLPVVGGVLAGWLASRKVATVLQILFYLVAVAMLTASAPDHGGSYVDVLWIAPALAVVSAITLLIGLRLGRKGARRGATQP